MSKTITSNQLLGEIGEAAVRLRFLNMGFQFDGRSRLEAGVDGIAEVMDNGRPLARMIAVQVKAKESAAYASETDDGFTYLLRPEDLAYWRGSYLPIIIVLYRRSDDTYFWKEVGNQIKDEERRLQFDKKRDILDKNAVDRLAGLTVPKAGFGYYVPPIRGGEEALVNILPVILPAEMFVSSTPHSRKRRFRSCWTVMRRDLIGQSRAEHSGLSAIPAKRFARTLLIWMRSRRSTRLFSPFTTITTSRTILHFCCARPSITKFKRICAGTRNASSCMSERWLKIPRDRSVALATRVPEDIWGSQKNAVAEPYNRQERMFG